MSGPLFTIITPNYNSGSKLIPTANSILIQESDFEYLITDGASSDDSIAIAEDLTANHGPVVRLYSSPDRGVYDAMNRAIGLARGRYLYFIGAGDTLLPNALADITPHLGENERTLVYGDVIRNGKRYDGPFDGWKLRSRNLPHQAAFYGREIFTLLGQYDLKYRMLADWAFNLSVVGDRRIRKKYVDLVVANYEGGGLSDTTVDAQFAADRKMLLGRLGIGSHIYAGLRRTAGKLHRLTQTRNPLH